MDKKQQLYAELRRYPSIAIAFSGGVDSTLLLAAARQCLGEKAIAVTATSPLQPRSEIDDAVKLASIIGAPHFTVNTSELENLAFSRNPDNRCYICKKLLFADIRIIAESQGISTVAHGANLDDFSDYRPGMKAAEEMAVAAPLIAAQFTKDDIRNLSQQMGLPNWNKPSAACLASRIPYGSPITCDALAMVESAERVMAALGFMGCRVRHFGETARIEVRPADFSRLLKPDRRLRVIGEFRKIGFLYVTMDLEGYQTGRLNRSILS